MLRLRQIAAWWNIMKRVKPSILAEFCHSMGTHKRSVDEQGYPVTDNLLPDSVRTEAPELWSLLRDECLALDLNVTALSVSRLIHLFQSPDTTQGKIKGQMQEIYGRIRDELASQYFLSLSPSEAARFEKWEAGWEKILSRFGDITRDVEEMNKCFALERYTAAMFHALHVAEWGAIELGSFIGVTDPKKGWGPTEKKLREIIKAGHANLPASLNGKFEFLEQMNREIESMVLAWRHKVDHAANHLAILPNTDFTPDVAEHIIGSVRIYMLRLMDGLA